MRPFLFLVRILRQAQHERTRQTGAIPKIVTFLLLLSTPAQTGVFQSITVSSPRATAKQIPNTELTTITYFPKVRVKLADKTDIRAGSLAVTIASNALQQNSNDPLQSAVFKDNVRIKRPHQRAQADEATLDINTNICTLKGNVVIKHIQQRGHKHVPITTRGDKASINLKTHAVALEGTEGTEHERVETTIELGGRDTTTKPPGEK